MNEKVKKLLDHAKVAEVENAYIGHCLHRQDSFITAKLSMTLRGAFSKRFGSVRRLNGKTAPFCKRSRLLAQIVWLANSKHDEPPRSAAFA